MNDDVRGFLRIVHAVCVVLVVTDRRRLRYLPVPLHVGQTSFLSPPQELQAFPVLVFPRPAQTGQVIVLEPLHVLQAILPRSFCVVVVVSVKSERSLIWAQRVDTTSYRVERSQWR